jgi:hypothetical protein
MFPIAIFSAAAERHEEFVGAMRQRCGDLRDTKVSSLTSNELDELGNCRIAGF